MNVQIKNRYTGTVLFECEAVDFSDAVKKALRGGSDLRGSDLRDCNLRDCNLRGCDLRDCDLRDCDLSGSDLSGSDLRDCNLRGSDLRGCDLRDCDLRDCNLRDCKNIPLVISGLRWVVQISGTGWMQIGCQKYGISEWAAFTDYEIHNMSRPDALPFWNTHKSMLLGLCDTWKHPEPTENTVAEAA